MRLRTHVFMGFPLPHILYCVFYIRCSPHVKSENEGTWRVQEVHERISIFIQIHMHMHIYTHIYIYIYTYIYTHRYIYIYTHIHTCYADVYMYILCMYTYTIRVHCFIGISPLYIYIQKTTQYGPQFLRIQFSSVFHV